MVQGRAVCRISAANRPPVRAGPERRGDRYESNRAASALFEGVGARLVSGSLELELLG